MARIKHTCKECKYYSGVLYIDGGILCLLLAKGVDGDGEACSRFVPAEEPYILQKIKAAEAAEKINSKFESDEC